MLPRSRHLLSALPPSGTGESSWWTIREGSRATGIPKYTLSKMVRKGCVSAKKAPNLRGGGHVYLISEEQLHLAKALHKPHPRAFVRDQIADDTWAMFLVVWGKFCRGETWPNADRKDSLVADLLEDWHGA